MFKTNTVWRREDKGNITGATFAVKAGNRAVLGRRVVAGEIDTYSYRRCWRACLPNSSGGGGGGGGSGSKSATRSTSNTNSSSNNIARFVIFPVMYRYVRFPKSFETLKQPEYYRYKTRVSEGLL